MKKYFQAPWNIKDLLVVCGSAFLLIIIAILLIDFFELEKALKNSSFQGIYLTVSLLVQWLLILTPLFILTYSKYKFKLRNFGFEKVSILTVLKEVLLAYFAYLGITLIISMIIVFNDLKIPGYQMQQNILPLFGTDTFSLLIAALIIVLLAPLLEELFFRGFLLRTLTDKIGIFLGSIISALIFAAVHFPWQSFIPIFILGLIINSLVIKTKSVWTAVAFHIFNNSLVFVFELLSIKDVISIEKLV